MERWLETMVAGEPPQLAMNCAATHSSLLDDDDQAVHYFVDLRLENATGTVENNARVGRE